MKTKPIIQITLIGAGNVATNLGIALQKEGYQIAQVYSKTKKSAEALAKKINADDAAFFISQNGNRMSEFYQRLEQMKQRAELNKNITLHGLRHSIATHLLQSGMDIEEIAKFLGHISLASTQIYTHIINEHDREV